MSELRQGWRGFLCDCGKMWRLATRDYHSQSVETCPECMEDVRPIACWPDILLNVDKYGNLLSPPDPQPFFCALLRSTPLTKDEQAVLDKLGDAWSMFVKLESLHPDELPDFRRLIHVAQQTVMARPIRRALKSEPGPDETQKPDPNIKAPAYQYFTEGGDPAKLPKTT